jgi:hypothetical protein
MLQRCEQPFTFQKYRAYLKLTNMEIETLNPQPPAPPVVVTGVSMLPTAHPYQQVINVLAAAFDHFNTVLLNGELTDTPIIAVLPRGRRAAYGWFIEDKWNDKNIKRPEINVSAEHLNRPITNVLGTLAHEMCHQLNAQNGLKDCNKAQYHNKHFKLAAERMGLVVTRVPNKGFACTTVGTTLQAAIDVFCQMENTSAFTDFERLESTTTNTYKPVCTIPCYHTDKNWFERQSLNEKLTQKDLLNRIIVQYITSQNSRGGPPVLPI